MSKKSLVGKVLKGETIIEYDKNSEGSVSVSLPYSSVSLDVAWRVKSGPSLCEPFSSLEEWDVNGRPFYIYSDVRHSVGCSLRYWYYGGGPHSNRSSLLLSIYSQFEPLFR